MHPSSRPSPPLGKPRHCDVGLVLARPALSAPCPAAGTGALSAGRRTPRSPGARLVGGAPGAKQPA